MQPISLAPVDAVHVTVLMDNVVDLLLRDQGPAKRIALTKDTKRVPVETLLHGEAPAPLIAEHGFSLLVTVHANGRVRRLIFDAGVSVEGVVQNMRMLDIAAKDVEAIVLSHGHFDHATGLGGLYREIGREGLPAILHPDFFLRRRIAVPGNDAVELPTTSRRGLEDAGFAIVEDRRPSFLLDGAVLVTGEVDRTTDFEKGFPVHQALRGEAWEPDPLILDDQALLANVRDKGLVIITGCGHSGIVNIVRHAKRVTGVDRVHAIIGGFHLGGPLFEPLIPQVTAALAAEAPNAIVPGHCTGWRAQHALAAAMPDAFIQTSVATRFEL